MSRLLGVIVTIEALIFYLPAALLYSLITIKTIGSIITTKDSIPLYILIACGFGLVSLGYLLFNFTKQPLSSFPTLIKLGLIVGSLMSIALFYLFTQDKSSLPPTALDLLFLGGVFLGPLLLEVTLLLIIRSQYLKNPCYFNKPVLV